VRVRKEREDNDGTEEKDKGGAGIRRDGRMETEGGRGMGLYGAVQTGS